MSDQQASGSSNQSEGKKNPQRKAKENINYRENRKYNRPSADEDVDITRKSTVTPRSPPTIREEYNHSTPNQSSDESEEPEYTDSTTDLLSSRVDGPVSLI